MLENFDKRRFREGFVILIQQDKIEHWAFGFVLTLFAIIDPVFIFLGLIFAVGKEIYDHSYKHEADGKDMIATCIGAFTAMVFLVVAI